MRYAPIERFHCPHGTEQAATCLHRIGQFSLRFYPCRPRLSLSGVRCRLWAMIGRLTGRVCVCLCCCASTRVAVRYIGCLLSGLVFTQLLSLALIILVFVIFSGF